MNVANDVEDCMNDIKMAGDDQWAKSALENLKAQCVQEFSTDTSLLPTNKDVRTMQKWFYQGLEEKNDLLSKPT